MQNTPDCGRRLSRPATAIAAVCSRSGQRLSRWFFSLALAGALTGSLAAQTTTGSLSGRVLDASTGKYLEGADITVTGTGLHTTSERGGAFSLAGVPAGDQQISANYPGLSTLTMPVTITAGANTSSDVNFNSDVVKLEKMHVAGMKEGSAQAIALQKAAVNMKVVAAGDQYGDIAEGNAAEYLKFSRVSAWITTPTTPARSPCAA